ncbi:MAG: hypothetical protein A2X56_04690 [Nitrospirae bacterium GWC2_57_13]|jgi:RNA polymerase sigma-70 factor, ECF subfamily|nr:MAG: hypothetical protein A2X56_04690 [Nitrospirae bacterium GWC2_57_13]OGW44220.1 MAG: hypothetical protein A2X57_11705 [Nitrospirae bacterium GWD2_57_8]
MDLTDEKIVEQCLKGDREIYSLLVDKYQQMIYVLAYRMLGDEAAAKDAAQESFISGYLSLRSFRREAKFSSWLTSIALNKCRDMLRGRKDTVSVDDLGDVLPGKGADPEERYRQKENEDVLQEALGKLPDEYREVIVLKHIRGLDYAEIAQTAGVSEGALKIRAWRAREMLRFLLKEGQGTHV